MNLVSRSITNYPEFRTLTKDLRDPYVTLVSQYLPYSDFNFTSIFSWSSGEAEVCMLKGNLLLKMPDYIDGSTTYSLLGTNKVDEAVAIILAEHGELDYVPDITKSSMRHPELFNISKTREHFDYIYNVESLAKLEGRDYKKLRNKIHTFEIYHADIPLSTKHHTVLNSKLIDEIIKLDKEWSIKSSRDQGDTLNERKAIKYLLDNFNDLSLILTCVYAGDKLIAFSINELLDDHYALCHFEKALTDHHVNTGPYIIREVAKYLLTKGATLLNWEQDLGLEGLRRSKMGYHPVTMLEKYKISRL